ncbi:MAG: cation:proton antiporter [bacterium]
MNIFIGVSVVIVIATVIAGILQKLKQPLIIGYILTGLIIGPFLFKSAEFSNAIDMFSQFGVALLLFIIGLNLSPKVFKEVGKISVLIGIGQLILTDALGLVLGQVLGFSFSIAIYLAIAITFSSTIIVMKLLSDKKDLSKMYAKIAVGLLLFQDLTVTFLLIGISATTTEVVTLGSVALMFIKGLVAIDLIILISIFLLPRLTRFFARSQEFLFLFSIGWGLGFATLFHYLGFSIEIGALIAGIALSTSAYHHEISSRLHPLRDFFIVLFFIMLGSKINIMALGSMLLPAILISTFVLVVKPLVVMIFMGILGYRKKTSFLTAVTMGQLSEFSLIFLMILSKNGQIPIEIVSMLTLVSLISIAGSTYMVIYSTRLYRFLSNFLSIFERKVTKKESKVEEGSEVILFGCNRIGRDFLNYFRELEKSFLIVDINPEVIEKLQTLNFNCRYGDADDDEFLKEIDLNKVKMVISTIPDYDTNEFLISRITQTTKNAIIIVISHNIDDAIGLYEAGATYVITPHFLGGHYTSMMISKYGFDIEKFIEEKEKHILDLERRRDFGDLAALEK